MDADLITRARAAVAQANGITRARPISQMYRWSSIQRDWCLSRVLLALDAGDAARVERETRNLERRCRRCGNRPDHL